jgi:hypothetical protein
MKMCEHSLPMFSDEMELPLMSLPEASPAKISALPASKQEWVKAPVAASGPKSSDLLASYDQNSSSWRTLQHCLVAQANKEADGLAEFSEIWPNAGMMRNGKTYQRRPWALPIAESASGLLPTPAKADGHSPFSANSMNLKERGGARKSGAKIGFSLKWDRRSIPYLMDGLLLPDWTGWLMGFDKSWTELEPLETLSFRKFPKE